MRLLRNHARRPIAPSLTLKACARLWIGDASSRAADSLLSPTARTEPGIRIGALRCQEPCSPSLALTGDAEATADVVRASGAPPALCGRRWRGWRVRRLVALCRRRIGSALAVRVGGAEHVSLFAPRLPRTQRRFARSHRDYRSPHHSLHPAKRIAGQAR